MIHSMNSKMASNGIYDSAIQTVTVGMGTYVIIAHSPSDGRPADIITRARILRLVSSMSLD